MVRRILRYLLFGALWGCGCFVFSASIGSIIMGEQWIISVAKDFTEQVTGSVLVGICCASTSIVYTFESLERWQQISLHFTIGLTGYFVAAYRLNWMPKGNIEYSIAFVIFSSVMFVTIWMCFYLFYKWEAKKMNRRLEELKKESEADSED